MRSAPTTWSCTVPVPIARDRVFRGCGVLHDTVPDRRTTRRQALGLGAAAFAAASLRSPAAALADRRALFELDLAGEGLTASASAAGWRSTRVLRAPRRF